MKFAQPVQRNCNDKRDSIKQQPGEPSEFVSEQQGMKTNK